MPKRTFSVVMMALLLLCLIMLAFNVQEAKADAQTVYINADGSITPGGAPIATSDLVTYTFTGNISYPTYYGIVVQKSNTIIDGKGYTVQGNQSETGLYVSYVNNVTIKNINVKGAGYGIYLYSSYNSTLSGNNVTATTYGGISIDYSSYNSINGNNVTASSGAYGIELQYDGYTSITGNNISNNGNGIWLSHSSITISGNNIMANSNYGISLHYSGSNMITGNNFTNNSYGVGFDSSSLSNNIYLNNFINNTSQASSFPATNVWDNGYPSGGNYWSDYNGTDLHSGPYQNVTGSDGIGDTPYVIDSNNTDRYPLMQPWSLTQSTTSISIWPNPVVFGSPVTCNATVSGSRVTGNVTWSTTSIAGSFSQSLCTLSGGSCSSMYVDNFSGSVIIAAYYSGDSNNAPSIGSAILLVTWGGPVVYSRNYGSVQAAINAAPSGATVVIASGFYKESLIVNKMLAIVGEKDTPEFGGGASSVYLTLQSGASGSIVTGIQISSWDEGILVDNASNCRIYDNTLYSMGGCGIVLQGSQATGTLIADNTFEYTPTPINLTASTTGNIVYDNTFSSKATLTLNIGTSGNSVYENAVSASHIVLNMTSTANNLVYDNNFQASALITVLTSAANQWNTNSAGNYWSDYTARYPGASQVDSSGVWNTPYVIDNNNKDNYPLMNPWVPTPGHDVAVLNVVAAKTVIGLGYSGNFTLSIANEGLYSESFSLTAFANTTAIYAPQVNSLGSASQETLLFKWGTTGLAYGNYTLSVWAWPVPSETDVANNNFTLGVIKVTIPGDINGDFRVSLADLSLLAKAYNTKPGDAKWNPNADVNNDGKVALADLSIMAKYYNQHYP